MQTQQQENISNTISKVDWHRVTEQMHAKGHATLPLLTNEQCEGLKQLYESSGLFRKTVVMERYRFGMGEYKYFQYPLPAIIQEIRESVYPMLAPIANIWMKVLKIDRQFPDEFMELQKRCHDNKQHEPTVLMLKYGKGGFNTLHRDLYGDVYFPIQAVIFLNEPEEDYSGGEFVLTQQTPRAQSKVIVLKPRKRDMLVFTTNFRPVKGSKGYYRVNMKHGVSEVHEGERYTLGIIFMMGLAKYDSALGIIR